LGVGYDDLHHYGLPEDIVGAAHNFVIDCLFHNGLVGTVIYLLIIILLYVNAARFWKLLKKEKGDENDLYKLLVVVSFFWLIPFWTQEIMWEKYSLSIQFMYFGLIANLYRQKVFSKTTDSAETVPSTRELNPVLQ